MSEIDTVAEQERAKLKRELTELRQREESLRHCREVKLRQGRLKVQCRVTAFLHPAADCSPNGRGGSTQPLAAQRYLQEIKSERATFGEMAAKHSDCSSAKRGGDLGRFGPNKMQKAFEVATRKLQVSEVSGVVDTDSGVHIILRTE